MTKEEKELREEFFDGPASDSMSFEQFLIQKGRSDLVKPMKMAGGGEVELVRGDPNYYKDLMG
tara:strand:- start:3607 stop:3795 length:189 start_codon:yes stop_codon:yes gene_type:complete